MNLHVSHLTEFTGDFLEFVFGSLGRRSLLELHCSGPVTSSLFLICVFVSKPHMRVLDWMLAEDFMALFFVDCGADVEVHQSLRAE